MDIKNSSKRIFMTAWDMMDGAADIGNFEDKIKWVSLEGRVVSNNVPSCIDKSVS